jgi:hypothetical protein
MTTTEPTAPGPTRDPADTLCAQCGAELADDQEWCLECGGARTMIHRAPDWRVPVVVIGIVVASAIAVLVVALLNTSSNSNSGAAAQSPAPAAPVTSTRTAVATTSASRSPAKTTATTGATTTATTGTTATANVAGWPAGLPGWTVVLASSHSQQVAYADASRVANAGIQVGVLDSTEHPKLAPGYWVVFSGRYPTQAAAAVAAERLISLGQTKAHPRLVGRVGAA